MANKVPKRITITPTRVTKQGNFQGASYSLDKSKALKPQIAAIAPKPIQAPKSQAQIRREGRNLMVAPARVSNGRTVVGDLRPVGETPKAPYYRESGVYQPSIPKPLNVQNQSTTTLSSDKTSDIYSNNAMLDNFSNKGVQTDNEGNPRYADGSFVTDTQAEDDEIQNYLESMKKSLDATTKAQIDNIQQKFDQRRQQQEEINRSAEAGTRAALLMGGATGAGSSAQYAPVSSGGIMQAQASYGLKQIADLDSQENDAIAQAREYQQKGEYQLMERQLELVQKKRDEKVAAAAKLNEEIAKENREIAKQNAIADVYDMGITDTAEALKQLRRMGVNATAKDVSDTIGLLSGIGGSGIVGEYNFYRAQAKAAGQVPIGYLEFKNAKYNTGGSGSGTSINVKTGTNASSAQKALSVILGSSKFTKDQKQSVIDAIDSGEDPFTVIKNQTKNIMGQTNATKLDNLESSRDAFNDFADRLKEFYDKGGKTSLISGNFEKVYNKLGNVKDPDLVELATQLQGAIQSYRNAISGTAYSDQEGRDIASIFPGINKTQSLNQAIINGRKKLFDSSIDSMYRSTLGSVYDELKNGQVDNSVASNLIQEGNQAKQKITNFAKQSAQNQTLLKTLAQAFPNASQIDIYNKLKAKGLIQ